MPEKFVTRRWAATVLLVPTVMTAVAIAVRRQERGYDLTDATPGSGIACRSVFPRVPA
jgi:hypothetical protein